jgi:hypothetical protein
MNEDERLGVQKIAVKMLMVSCFALGIVIGSTIDHYFPNLLAWLFHAG